MRVFARSDEAIAYAKTLGWRCAVKHESSKGKFVLICRTEEDVLLAIRVIAGHYDIVIEPLIESPC